METVNMWLRSGSHEHEWTIRPDGHFAVVWSHFQDGTLSYQWWAIGPSLNAGGFESTADDAKAAADRALPSC